MKKTFFTVDAEYHLRTIKNSLTDLFRFSKSDIAELMAQANIDGGVYGEPKRIHFGQRWCEDAVLMDHVAQVIGG